jgi:hypothetical protein
MDMSKTETGWQFALRFMGDIGRHPDGSHQVYRSDDMIGNGGRLFVSSLGNDAMVEVPYGGLSMLSHRDVTVNGVPVVRVRRKLDGTVVGEWIRPSAAASTGLVATSPRTDGSSAPVTGGRDALAGALKLAGVLFSRSSGTGMRALGALLSNVSEGLGESAGREATASIPVEDVPNQEVPRASVSVPVPGPASAGAADGTAEPSAIPRIRICGQCKHFRPYARVSDRFTEAMADSAVEEAVARGLDDLRSIETKGKGEEAKQLADLYRRGADRWVSRPSFFSYCAAHERDERQPTFFIAQIRNADQRCRPVLRGEGGRFGEAPTDFTAKDPVPRSCGTCAHRVRAPGPSEDARELREIVSSAVQAELMSAAVGKGSGAGAGVLSSYPEMKRKNAAAARAREMGQSFAHRAMDSHVPTEPRYVDTCGFRSDPGRRRWRVCAVENANDCCPDWVRN